MVVDEVRWTWKQVVPGSMNAASEPVTFVYSSARPIHTVWFAAINHDVARTQYIPRVPLQLAITRIAGLKCSSGSGTLTVRVDGIPVTTQAFSTTSGGPADDRAVSIYVPTGSTIEFVTSGTFTVFRGTVSGKKI